MVWQYRTIVFEFSKDGLLGDRYIDDEDMEATLNEQGKFGWELVDVVMVQEGVLAVLKRPEDEVAETGQESLIPVAEQRSTERSLLVAESPFSAEQIQKEEKEHIQTLETQRQDAMKQHERDMVGDIKIS